MNNLIVSKNGCLLLSAVWGFVNGWAFIVTLQFASIGKSKLHAKYGGNISSAVVGICDALYSIMLLIFVAALYFYIPLITFNKLLLCKFDDTKYYFVLFVVGAIVRIPKFIKYAKAGKL